MLIQRTQRTSTPSHPLIPFSSPPASPSPSTSSSSSSRETMSPRTLFLVLCGIVTFFIIMSVQLVNEDPVLDVQNGTKATTVNTEISPHPPSPGDYEASSDDTNVYNDFGSVPQETDVPPTDPHQPTENSNANIELEKKRKRIEELGVIEQANIAKYQNGILGIFPLSASEAGQIEITFIYAIQNDSIANNWPARTREGYFGGCVIDGTWVPISNVNNFGPSKVFFVCCKIPAHSPGEVEVGVIIDNVTRYADNGTASRFTYTSLNSAPPSVELAVCTVMQNQGRYLKEWIAFHSIFGVTKFYLYDQSDVGDWKNDIKDYIDSGIVENVRWKFDWMASIRHQAVGFWHCVKTFGVHTKWIAFIDVDEFLFIPRASSSELPYPSLVKFLANFSTNGGVMVDRINFGPNGHLHRPPGLVIESYTKRTINTESKQPCKSIVQPAHVDWAGCGGVHTFAMEKGYPNVDAYKRTRNDGCGIPYENVVWDPIRINHYWTKSAQDWVERMSRPDNPYPVAAEDMMLTWNYFSEEDTDILEYAEETKRRMLWGIPPSQ